MIKPNELRIGNWVNRLGKPTVISAIQEAENIGYVSTPISGAITINQIEPIPLSEEWLLKFGCKKVGYHWETSNGISFNFDSGNKCTLILFGARHVHFYYVHTFQNIMALTGEELQIKETV
jgi:hypothetical protein